MPHRCEFQGWLSGPQTPAPDDPTVFAGPANTVPCSRLSCPYCGHSVRSRAGWRVRAAKLPAGQEARAATWSLYDAESWQPTDWLSRDESHRTWLCRCTILSVHEWTAILRTDRSEMATRQAPWACAGHPDATFPLDLAGPVDEPIALDHALAAIFEAGDADALEQVRSLSVRATPEIGRQIGTAAALALTNATAPQSLRFAFALANLNPSQATTDAVLSALQAGRLDAIPDPDPFVGPTLAHRGWRIASRLAPLSVDKVREASLRGFAYALAGPLFENDLAWLVKHLSTIVAAEPTTALALLSKAFFAEVPYPTLLTAVDALPRALQREVLAGLAEATYGEAQVAFAARRDALPH